MLLWGNAAYELDRYLSESDRITPGTAPPFGCPTEQLPYLKKGVPLYDATLAWINHDWGGCTTMPPRGRQLWYLVLRLSRGGNAPADSLKQWANWLVENIAAESRPTGNAPPLPSGSSPEQKELHPDGPGGGRWLWWKNKRYDVPKGTVYRLLEYVWTRDSASYDELDDARVFDSAVAPQTVRSYANKANNALPAGFPWRLSADSTNRQLTKVATAKGA